MAINPEIIEKAYNSRMFSGKSWEKIGSEEGVFGISQLEKAVTAYAARQNLPKPVRKNLDLGVKTYELLRKGLDLMQIAPKLGLEKPYNRRCYILLLIARNYAKQAQREWPPL